jgi:type IV pilus assembly protein PilQ
MKKTIKHYLTGFILFFFAANIAFTQEDRIFTIKTNLDKYAVEYAGLNEAVELSVSNSSLQEFIRGIALSNQLNVNIDPSVSGIITNNFSNAKVKDVYLFLCRQYDLEIDFIGSIISFKKYIVTEGPVAIYSPAKPNVEINADNNFLTLKLKRDTLDYVAEQLTELTGKNVILSPEVKGKKVSVFIKNRPFDEAIEKMGISNGLKVTKTSEFFYLIELAESSKVKNATANNARNIRNGKAPNNKGESTNLLIEVKDDLFVSVNAKDASIQEIIEEVSQQMFQNYFLYDIPTGKANLFIENASYTEFLSYLLSGSDFTYKQTEDVFLIGNKNDESLRQSTLIELENRRIENVLETVPAKLKEGLEIAEFIELNGIVVSGSATDIRELEEFIDLIDVIVPVVTIEVIIADVNDTKTLSTGIQAGLGDAPTATSSTGTLSPGIDVNLSTNAINDVVSGVNGLGIVNLGNVSPNFYLSIKALEDAGEVNIKSTPTVATLNGHETVMKIGDQQYYLEVNNQIVNNTVNSNVFQSQQWKSVTADLTITITPYVSKDEQVTLDLSVVQSTFTSKVSETAPPGQTTRNFESLIRVKNGDMVLLGGLDEVSKMETSSGVPFLSRIPIIKWLFSSRTKAKTKKQLTIFIRPTVSYE